MPGERSSNFAWYAALTVLLGAVLLFLVQPIISKMILPWYGGSPAVWTTCMLCFQSLLLAGYAYAHLLVRTFSLGWQMRVHGVVTLIAALTLPITPSPVVWEPRPEAEPISSILLLLLMNIGLPFFALAATGPLVQSWFGSVYPGRPPYRLYALSNVGSLAALWLFPLWMEPNLPSGRQDFIWSGCFGAYLVMVFLLSLAYERMPVDLEEQLRPSHQRDKPPLVRSDVALWLLLPALASALLVAITAHICQDVAVVPMLWILPLSLYLLSFIIVFDSPRWYLRGVWGWLTILSLVAVSIVMLDDPIQERIVSLAAWWGLELHGFDLTDYTGRADIETLIYLLALFGIAMLCHGETVRKKAEPGNLTVFYLAIAAGGVLGTALVAIVCPLVFDRFYELNLGLVLGFLVAGTVIVSATQNWFTKPRRLYAAHAATAVLLSAGFALVVVAQYDNAASDDDVQVRNFYGIASVRTLHYQNSDKPYGRVLYNGQINHGFQFLDDERRYQPTSYYAEGSGVQVALRTLREANPGQPLKVAVIGLGTGTMAAHGEAGDQFVFFEIDDKIRRIASEYFTYLADSKAQTQVIMGDARLSLTALEQPQAYDLIVVDAFSGDAIPVHLLTLEAFELYRRHLKKDGILAVHTSNRHLALAPVTARLADQVGWDSVLIENSGGDSADEASSDWVLVTNNPRVLQDEEVLLRGEFLTGEHADAPLWTDTFSNLRQVMD
jgi:protein-L-isoaspartate O-methyltransferase